MDGGTIQIRDLDGGAIAQVWGSNEEAYANASLIHAAPKLYELLENVAIAICLGWDVSGIASEIMATLDHVEFMISGSNATKPEAP